jgi:hypothetical protein
MNVESFLMMFYSHKAAHPLDELTTDQRVKEVIKHIRLVKSVFAVVDWESLEPDKSVESEEKKRAVEMLGSRFTRKENDSIFGNFQKSAAEEN